MNIEVKILDTILIAITSYIILFTIISITKFIKKKRIDKGNETTIFLPGKNKRVPHIIYNLYLFFSNWTLTKTYFERISNQFKQISIDNQRDIADRTMKTILKIWVINIIIIFILFALKPNFMNAIITIAYLIFVNNETVVRVYIKLYIKLNFQFDKWLGDYMQNYQGRKGIVQSIHDTLDKVPNPLKEHINIIYKILNSDEDMEEESLKYIEVIPNRFIKMFLTTTIVTLKHGDSIIDNKSLYLTSIGILKQELYNEIMITRRKNLIINAAIPIIMLPMSALGLIEYWGVMNFPELASYYESGMGLLLVIIIVLSTLGLYEYFNFKRDELKVSSRDYKLINYISKIPFINTILDNILDNYHIRTYKMEQFLKSIGEKITVKQLLIKRILMSLCTFLMIVIVVNLMHQSNRNNILNDVSNIAFDSTISQKDSEVVKQVILKYTLMFKERDITVNELEDLLMQNHIRNKIIATATAEEILNRIIKYQNEFFKWNELVIALLISYIAFFIPLWSIQRQVYINQRKMLNEVMQYTSIILMLMYVKNMSKDIIIEWLELYSDIFKDALRKCITDLDTGEVDAFENLKKNVPYTPFVRIVECMENTDKQHIKDAFSMIPEERNRYMEIIKLEDEIYLRQISSRVSMFSLVPMGLVIYLYLIMPLLIETLYNNSISKTLISTLIEK